MIAVAVNLSCQLKKEMQLAEMLKTALISNCLLCSISDSGKKKINCQCSSIICVARDYGCTLTGDGTDVFVRFKFSGDVMSLVIPVFIGLILNLDSNNELRTLFDL